MRDLSLIVFGVPLSRARVRAEVEQFVRLRDVHVVRQVITENISHITGKSGALLQAQGIFVVVATYMQDNGWPRALTLTSLLLLIVSALMVMTNLRSVFLGVDFADKDSQSMELEVAVRSAILVSRRGAIFNVALYMTFLSIFLMGAGAVSLEL